MGEQKLTGYPSIDKPWLKYYSEEAFNFRLPEKTIFEHITEKNADNLNRVAISYYGNNFTYKEFFNYINTIAFSLLQLGVKQGDVVTVCMINSPETICLLFALNKIGAVANMVCGASTVSELTQFVLETKSEIVFTLDIFQDKILQIADTCRLKSVIVASITRSMSLLNRLGAKLIKKMKPITIQKDRRFIPWDEFLRSPDGNIETVHAPEATAIITYTGGTTGGSKGVALSNKAVIAVAEQYILGERELYRQSKWAQVLPLFIAYGVTCSLMIPLCVGMTLIVRIPMADSIAKLCRKYKPNHIMYGPAFWEAFADDNKNLDLSYLIAPITGGDTLRATTETKINDYLKKCGSRYMLMNGYGMTEVGAAVSVNYRDVYEFGSVGVPFVKNVVSAFDVETGEELRIGEEGEICICTPSAMSYYINNKEETDKILRRHKDGQLWIHSGDLGYISENGFIHISGRLKRYMLCIKNGVQKKVFSLDVERALLQNPCVDNCAVVPIDDPEINQVPVAFVILKSEYMKSADNEKSLREHCNKSLPDVYRPVKYFFVKEFPHTKVGKVDYRALEREAEKLTIKS